jgi:hypothetical protein
MMQKADASGSLALSPRPRNASRLPPKPVDSHRTRSTAGAFAMPVAPAEIAQARVFEDLLQAECAELQELAHRIGPATDQLPDADNSEQPQDLAQIRARLDEVHRLLGALQGRFPHARSALDRRLS